MKKVNILGTEYEIVESTYKDDSALLEYGGYCDRSARKIVISMESPPHPMAAEDQEVTRRATIRHELTHAFFAESGHSRWCDDEDLVDWIALQFPKMMKAMQELECIE